MVKQTDWLDIYFFFFVGLELAVLAWVGAAAFCLFSARISHTRFKIAGLFGKSSVSLSRSRPLTSQSLGYALFSTMWGIFSALHASAISITVGLEIQELFGIRLPCGMLLLLSR